MNYRQILSFVFLLFAVAGINVCFAQQQLTVSATPMPIATQENGRNTNTLQEEAKRKIVRDNESDAGLKHVILQLAWLNQFQFAGYYAAVEKGFYRDAGFNVTIVEGAPDKRPIIEVISGRANYGVARSELLLSRLHGQPVVVLASIFQHSAIILLVKKDSGIANPQDMIGKRVMLLPGDDAAEYIAMFKNEGISLDKIKIIPSTYNIDDLIDGKTDVFNAYITNEPFYLEQQGIPASIISPITYGIDFYGDCLFTSEHEMEKHPEQVKAFRAASLRGWEYAMAHSEEIINVIASKYGVEKSREHLRFEAEAIRKLMLPDLVEIGLMNPGRWQHMADTYVALGMADSGYSLEGFMYDPNPTPDYSWVPRVLGIVISLIILISLGFFILLRFNKKLRVEVAQRKQIEERLSKAHSELELRVKERTAELTAANEKLHIENIERERAEEENRLLNQELEQRVADRTAQLEAANKELEAFAYSVSHDLRAPLRHIDGFLELLQKNVGTVLDEQGRHYMDTIADAAKRMGLLIDDLLAFSRMGRHKLSRMPVDLNRLVQGVIRELEPETEGRTIHWQIANLPVVPGDCAMLRMVLVNLIANAVKFTRPCDRAEIEIGCQPGEGEVVVFVRDNGVGFDMQYADKLFDVFQRLHRMEDFEGTGIGLANVRRIIARHGGRTWAEGAVNQGATFYMVLPSQ